jgi:hypothetical protein
VTCDLACNWKLDDRTQGRIAAGGTAKAFVEPGAVFRVEATTEDGADKTGWTARVEAARTDVNLQLRPVRDARLKAEQEARAEAAGLVWTDPATRLMWAKKDNGSDVTWQQAMDYCRNLKLAGHSDWRLPIIDELQGIYDHNINVPGHYADGKAVIWHVKGNLHLSGDLWSNSQGNASGEAWTIQLIKGHRESALLSYGATFSIRALCVRRSGE